jgi:hypothetical protein
MTLQVFLGSWEFLRLQLQNVESQIGFWTMAADGVSIFLIEWFLDLMNIQYYSFIWIMALPAGDRQH